MEYRAAEGQYERLPDLAAELVRLKVDVIVTQGTLAALAAKDVTTVFVRSCIFGIRWVVFQNCCSVF